MWNNQKQPYYVFTLLVVYYSGGETGHDEILNLKFESECLQVWLSALKPIGGLLPALGVLEGTKD